MVGDAGAGAAARKGKFIPVKQPVDEVIADLPDLETVVVVRSAGAECAMQPGRDVWFEDLIAGADPVCPAEPMEAEHPLFLLYSSGSTAKPKGILHTTGGYLTGVTTTMAMVFDLDVDNDVFWCTADVGWITGHSMATASETDRSRTMTTTPAWCAKSSTSTSGSGPSVAASTGEMRIIMEEVFVLSAVRTPIGRYGGGLASVPPCDLAAKVVREAVARSGAEPGQVGHAVFGHVIHTEVRDMYLARVAALNGGLEDGTPALTLNRLCGSGLQAIVSASQSIMLGDCEVAVAGGAESMSRAPYWLPGLRWGQRMNDGVTVDPMVGALTDPFDACHMGVTAENVAADFGVSRADQDALAAESHRRAAAAAAAGYFTGQILPVEVPGKKGATVIDTDEHVRPSVSLDDMARLRPAFAPDGTVTAGNASGLNDAAAAVVLASGSFVASSGLTPIGKLAGYAHAGVEPRIMGMGPVPATRKVLDRTGLKVDEMDVFEVNEAFAAQALAVARELDLPPERTNPNGSGISLGHPIGATGAILAVKSLYELKRTGGRYALATMYIGGGQGIAAIFERVLSRAGRSARHGTAGPGHAKLQEHLRGPRRRQAAADLRPDGRRLERLGKDRCG